MTAVLCIILGMGLPTTANYLVVAALMAQVAVEVGSASGYVFPLNSYSFVCFLLWFNGGCYTTGRFASYAAAAISKADPIKNRSSGFLV